MSESDAESRLQFTPRDFMIQRVTDEMWLLVGGGKGHVVTKNHKAATIKKVSEWIEEVSP